MDKKLEEANHKFLGIGAEGVEHKFENGKYYPILPKFNEERGNMYWYFDAVDTKKWPDYWLARNQKNPFNYQIFIRMLEDKATAGKFDPTAYAPPSEATVKYTSSLDVMVKDYYVKIVAGAESLANFNKFIANWESSGGKDVEKAFNDWYRAAKK
jgi:putative aldouronate transport system substrate-binding protein